MCCRYSLRTLQALVELCEALGIKLNDPQFAARYNAALTQRMPVIVKRPKAELTEMAFGLTLPARTPGEKPMLVPNARADSLLGKPSFRDAAQHRRCLVPADGFFEWEKAGAARLPHYFHLKDEKPFFFGAVWQPETETTPASFAIVTTEANDVLRPIHERMPVMLGPNSGPAWLGDEPLTPTRLAQLCRPLRADMMVSHRVDPRMNSVRYEAADCVAPLPA